VSGTVYRDICGSHAGMLAHQAHDEDPCGSCRSGEMLRRLQPEAITWPPEPLPRPVGEFPPPEPVTMRDAARNRQVLAEEIGCKDDYVPETLRRRWDRRAGAA
jgi:hypothetical protein